MTALAAGFRHDPCGYPPCIPVRLIKSLLHESNPAAQPRHSQVPSTARVLDDLKFSGTAAEEGVPAVAYHWDFGDGIKVVRRGVPHTYTESGQYVGMLTADVDGLIADQRSRSRFEGLMEIVLPRRYAEPLPGVRRPFHFYREFVKVVQP